MTAYHIKQWDALYEKWETRKTDYMPWYSKQTKLTGLGIGFTLRQPDNVELLGLWTLIETLASQSNKHHRGWLVRNGRPLSADMMAALLPTISPAKFQRALDHFSSPEVDWLENLPWVPEKHLPGMDTPPATRTSPGDSPAQEPPLANEDDDTRKSPGDSPAHKRTIGEKLRTDRQTDRQITDRQTDKINKNGSLRLSESGPSLAEVLARSQQWAALTARQMELKGKPRVEWSDYERVEWQKNRAALKKLGEKQRAGVFA